MKVALFDTETTDLIKNTALPIDKQPKIIEFYAVKILQVGEGETSEFETLDEYESLYSHPEKLKDITTKITGLTNDDLKNSPAIETELMKIKSFFEDCDRVVAHNLSYDIGVTDFEFERHGFEKIDWPEKICTVEQTEHLLGYRLKLIDLYNYLFGKPFEGAHRAINDVSAMRECYEELVKRDEI